MNSTCNVCGTSFEIVPASLKIIKDGGIHFSYFECPECGTAYLYLVTNRELRRRIERGQGRYTITDALRRELEQRYTPRFAELVRLESRRDSKSACGPTADGRIKDSSAAPEKAYKPKTP